MIQKGDRRGGVLWRESLRGSFRTDWLYPQFKEYLRPKSYGELRRVDRPTVTDFRSQCLQCVHHLSTQPSIPEDLHLLYRRFQKGKSRENSRIRFVYPRFI